MTQGMMDVLKLRSNPIRNWHLQVHMLVSVYDTYLT